MSDNRDEIERIKRQMRQVDLAKRLDEALKRQAGSPEDRAIARAELDAEWAQRDDDAADHELEAHPGPDPAPESDRITYEELEAKRRELAAAGRHHGYDVLAKECDTSKATVQRRYNGKEPPGSPIPGVCDKAPPHLHPV